MSNSTPVSGASPRAPQVILEPNARVASVPKDLSDVKAPIKVEGEVVAQNRDGSVRIQTAQGSIDLVLPKPPAEGQRVDVTLLPGRPPRQAVVENAPQPSQPQQQPTQTSPASTPEPPRTAQTPVRVDVQTPAPPPVPQEGGTPAPVTPATPPPHTIPALEAGAVVTVVPLSPALEAQIVTTLPEQIQTVIVEKIETAVQNQVTQTEPALTPLPLASGQPITSPVTEPALQNQISNTTAQVFLENFIPAQTTANPVQIQPATVNLQTTSLQSSIPLAGTSVFSAPVLTRPLQVEIKAVTPPPALLTTPVETGEIEKPDFSSIIKSLPGDTPTLKTGIVTGFVQQSPVLSFFTPESTPLQNLLMQTLPENIPLGTQVQIAPPSPNMPGMIPVIPPAIPLPVSFLTPETWPMMQQIAQILSQIAPQAANAMANVTPNPANPSRFGAAALFFLAAVRAGDLTSWLGEKAIDALRRDGRGGLLSRLTQEGSALNRLSAEPINTEWRAMSLPMFWNGEMHKMALYYRQDEGGGMDGDEKIAFTRFVFDLNLSRMGKVQLDGLFRTKKLDLVVRTEKPFGPQTQMQLRRTYTNALEQTELSGELSFQNKPEQWIEIKPTNTDLFTG